MAQAPPSRVGEGRKGASVKDSWRWKVVVWVVAGATFALALGAYGKSIGPAERGSFVMNYPATGADCGGPSAKALTGSISVPLGTGGLIKQTFQPNLIEVASHSVRNVGDAPRRIRFDIAGFETTQGVPAGIEWHSRDRAWNPDTHEIERDILPGQAVDFGLVLDLPDPLPAIAVPLKGSILVRDAATGDVLSTIDVRFERAGYPSGGECCE